MMRTLSKSQASAPRLPRKYILSRLLTEHMQAALFSLGRLWRTPVASGMTIAVIAIALALPMSLLAILSNAGFVSQDWQRGTQITLFLQLDSQQAQIDDLITAIRSRPEVAYVNYISPQQGMRDLAQHEGFSDILTQLPQNPLPPVLEVYPQNNLYSADVLANVVDNLRQLPGVVSGQLDLQWLDRLNSIIVLLQRGVMVLALLLCSAVFLVITNTLRLIIQNSHQEINVFKLVGATDSFVRRPFLYSGFCYGFSGGLGAWLLVSLLIWVLQAPVRALAASYQAQYALTGLTIPTVFALLLVSALLGVVAAWVVVNRHIYNMFT